MKFLPSILTPPTRPSPQIPRSAKSQAEPFHAEAVQGELLKAHSASDMAAEIARGFNTLYGGSDGKEKY